MGDHFGPLRELKIESMFLRRQTRLPGLPEPEEMSYTYFNKNPAGRSVGDCAVRALSRALEKTWEEVYVGLCLEGFRQGDLPNADVIWGNYLQRHGFRRHLIPDDGMGRYTVADFAEDHPKGVFVLSMPGRHVVAVVDGSYCDSWDSGNEVPTYFFEKEA